MIPSSPMFNSYTSPLQDFGNSRTVLSPGYDDTIGHWSNYDYSGLSTDENYKSKVFSRLIRLIKVDQTSRSLALAFLVLLGFGLSEFVFSVGLNSVTLFASAFYTLSSAIAIGISLLSIALSKVRSTSSHTYGYERFEVIASFSNSAFLSFVGLFIVFEGVEKILESEKTEGIGYLFLLGLIGSLIHIGAHILYSDRLVLRSETIYAGEGQPNVSDIIFSAVPPLSVLFCAILSLVIPYYVDSIIATLIVTTLMRKSVPHTIQAGRVLLQSSPVKIRGILEASLRQIVSIEGVSEIVQKRLHFWTYSPGVYVGTLVIKIRPDADEQVILQQANNILSPFIQHLTIEIEKEHINPIDFGIQKEDNHYDHYDDDHCDHDHDHHHHGHDHCDHDHEHHHHGHDHHHHGHDHCDHDHHGHHH